jgi:coenzyme F420-reducing hydrogenase delta subunit/Pyruvate/2-oxoacid:ferredoxin oxidoreductase delta subunit
MRNFEPTIVGFVCNECVYAAADLAGTSRLEYPSNIRMIRVPCSGQVDLIHILRAFENGADAVFVGGCLKEQCHYVDGNYKAETRIGFLKRVLKAIGLEEERLEIHFMSASMAFDFVGVADELTRKIKKLGPSPLKKQKKTSIYTDKKRELLRDMLLSISKASGKRINDLNYVFPGFGNVVLDEKECFGCGACAYVCRDGAMAFETKSGNILIKNTYWRCTECRKCAAVCPKDCLDVEKDFDLVRFLKGKEEVEAKVGMTKCQRCGKSFLPDPMTVEMEGILANKTISSAFLGSCPKCRKFNVAEKVRSAQGFAGR